MRNREAEAAAEEARTWADNVEAARQRCRDTQGTDSHESAVWACRRVERRWAQAVEHARSVRDQS